MSFDFKSRNASRKTLTDSRKLSEMLASNHHASGDRKHGPVDIRCHVTSLVQQEIELDSLFAEQLDTFNQDNLRHFLKSPFRPPFVGEVVLRAHYRTGSRFAVLRTALKRLSSSMRSSSSLKSSSSMRSSTSMNKMKEPRLIFINRGSRSVATTYSSTW